MENKKMNCSNCGAVIEDTYYKCLDNCLQVNFFDTEEENTVQIEVLIQEDDMGRVIGKNGKVISGIRTVVQASSSLYDNKKVKINVSSY